MASAVAVLAPLVIVALVIAAFAVLAWRRPIILKMAVRNATRRKAQTAVVLIGLMVGTAIIAGSLVTGDTLEFGIKNGAYRALGPADELVNIEGYLYFPETVYSDLRDNATVNRAVAGMAPMTFESVSVKHPATKQSEPRVSVVGFDWQAEKAFGDFVLTDGRIADASTLGPRDAYLSEQVAVALGAKAGDTVTLSYSITPTPLIPRIINATGFLAGAGRAPAALPVAAPGGGTFDLAAIAKNLGGAVGFTTDAAGYVHSPQDVYDHRFNVTRGAVRITALVFPDPDATVPADLDVELVGPDGTSILNDAGTVLQPDIPVWINMTAPAGRDFLEKGEWSLKVHSKAASQMPWRALILVFHEVYDLNEFRNFTRQLEESGIKPEDFGFDKNFGAGGDSGGSIRKTNITVAGILAPEGPGNLFLAPLVWLPLEAAQSIFEKDGKINAIRVTNNGDTYSGVARSREVRTVLDQAVAAARVAYPDEPSLERLNAREIKSNWIGDAEKAGELFTTFLTTVSSFTIMAGIMLIVNIFIMLAEERKSELGMARAVGMPRRDLGLLFSFEGLLYAIVASFIGIFLGLLIAFALVLGFNDILTSSGNNFLDFPFHFEWASLTIALAAGFLITMVTVGLTSWRSSRLNIVRAIKRLEEPESRAGFVVTISGAVLAAVGLVMTGLGFPASYLPLKVLGPTLLVLGAAIVLGRWLKQKHVYPVAGGVLGTYSAASLFVFDTPDDLASQMMGPVRGMILVIASALIIVHLPWVMRAARAMVLKVKALRAAARPGVAYPLQKKTRTGLTVAMFALVMLVIAAFTTFSATFNIDLKEQSGGYDVDGETTVPIGDLRAWYAANGVKDGDDPFRDIVRHDDLIYANAFGGEFITVNGKPVNYQGPPFDIIYAYEPGFATNNAYELEERHPDYATDQEAYEAILTDDTLVIVSRIYTFTEDGQPGAFGAGATLSMNTTGGQKANFTVIGVQKQIYLGGVWVNEDIVRTNFQRVRGQYLFKITDGADPDEVAKELEAAFEDAGMNAVSIEAEAQKIVEQNRQFLTLFQLFLGFGLIVGIASLGIITARAVLERRQEIGMLRAIGYPRSGILKIFLVEIFFTTSLGIFIGTILGVFIAYGVATQALQQFGVQFVIPYLDLVGVILLAYAATLVCTFYPAWRASRIAPAEAVRYIE